MREGGLSQKRRQKMNGSNGSKKLKGAESMDSVMKVKGKWVSEYDAPESNGSNGCLILK